MSNKLIVALSLLFAVSQASAADHLARYVDVKLAVQSTQGVLMKHHGITEVGRQVRSQRVPGAVTETAARVDYRVVNIGVLKDMTPVATVEGSVYSGNPGGLWNVLSEFKTVIPLGRTGHMTFQSKSGITTKIDVEVNAVSEDALKTRFGSAIPTLKACIGLSDVIPATSVGTRPESVTEGVEMTTQAEDCCTVECHNGASSTLTCCGVIWCRDTSQGTDCCCSL